MAIDPDVQDLFDALAADRAAQDAAMATLVNDMADRINANSAAIAELRATPQPLPDMTPVPQPPTDPAPPPDPVTPVDDRPVISAWADTALDQSDVIYDFEGRSAADTKITALANTTVRNIVGAGSRRIGDRDGDVRSSIGFEDCEGTFFHMQHSGGAVLVDPFFVRCVDVNPQPHVGDGDIFQCFAYQGDIVRPVFDSCGGYGKERPSGSGAHNDTLQFTGIAAGRVVDPTVRNCSFDGASSACIQVARVFGVMTIEDCTLSERFGSHHAVIATKPEAGAEIRWRNNILLDGASAVFLRHSKTGASWSRHPDTIDQSGLTIQ